MYYSLCSQLTFISLFLLKTTHSIIASEAIEYSGEAFPEDFRVFLKGLTSMAHKHPDRNDKDAATTMRISTYRTTRPEVLLSSQKAALRDILMMKLVSYYEDKYRISRHVMTRRPETVEPIIFSADAQTTPTFDIFTEGANVVYDVPSPYDMRKGDPREFADVVVL